MPTVIPVKFKYATRDLWFDPAETGAQEGDHVICATERGTEIGLATSDASQISVEQLSATTDSELKPVIRIADDADLATAEELADRGDDAMPVFRELVEASGLDMKPVGVEYLFGGEKVVCYFAAEERVDFRQLVRDLSRELHERIDMRQIGVREEAALVGGFAHCGQELCCARFGHQFEPVSIRMAKEQDLPLNSTKISGACGRLMCCLRYEFEAYRDFKGRAPKKNAVIETPLGKAKILEYDTPKEQLALRLENGKQIRVPLAGMEASEAAHKKSDELGCPCRPDTVTRAALDALQSPDVQLALADLDRANGIVPEETFDTSDIFVDTSKRSGRSRRSRGTAGSKDQAGADEKASSQTEPKGSGEKRSRRRRGGSGQQGSAAKESNEQGQAQPQGQDQQASTRRRRHHRTSEGDGEATSQASSRQPSSDAEKPKAKRRTRRPGDKGGTAAQAGQQSARASQPGADGAQQPSGDGAPKRKRRHRGGRGHGHGNGGGGEGGASSAE